jgi:tRNA uridine 5-carboxymethylaminomethyl modification enzyme
VNGFSTSLPEDVLYNAIRKIEGFEQAKMFRPGYAIEYDFFPPTQLKATMETHLIENLYFAGQINGTTGYEEAASQGLMAGINASLKIGEKEPLILKRSDAYIGVLIDDLINKGTEEPYRMFTSRAEFRLLLRQDNADLRLTQLGHQIGLADDVRMEKMLDKKTDTAKLINDLKQKKLSPEEINIGLEGLETATIKEKISLEKLLKRPQIGLVQIMELDSDLKKYLSKYNKDVLEQAEILIKYDSYIEKEQQMVDKLNNMENYKIPFDFDYLKITALSAEGKQKMNKIRPETLGQASRISGVSPADLSILTVYLGR